MSSKVTPYLADLTSWLNVTHRPKKVSELVLKQDPVHLLTLYTSLYMLFYDYEMLAMSAESKGRTEQRDKWLNEQNKVITLMVPMQERLESLLLSVRLGGDPFADDLRGDKD